MTESMKQILRDSLNQMNIEYILTKYDFLKHIKLFFINRTLSGLTSCTYLSKGSSKNSSSTLDSGGSGLVPAYSPTSTLPMRVRIPLNYTVLVYNFLNKRKETTVGP